MSDLERERWAKRLDYARSLHMALGALEDGQPIERVAKVYEVTIDDLLLGESSPALAALTEPPPAAQPDPHQSRPDTAAPASNDDHKFWIAGLAVVGLAFVFTGAGGATIIVFILVAVAVLKAIGAFVNLFHRR